jgi:hypothetical protein
MPPSLLILDEPTNHLEIEAIEAVEAGLGATHFLMRRLPNVATEMALNVLAYNSTRVTNIVGIKPLLVAIRT